MAEEQKRTTHLTRDEAWVLLTRYNKDAFHLHHAETVERTMRCFARELGYGEEEDYWGIVGLLHDIDFEQWPQEHCSKSRTLLKELGVEDSINGVVSCKRAGLFTVMVVDLIQPDDVVRAHVDVILDRADQLIPLL